ncbi:hypothetical protein SDC9_52682 [bioreactor metagenome]|uniref:Uncharacterized protein n=1 Tax=bioreactor metagenome TaxID=1076179 RepID=A0A644WWE3_9ZZZZ
MVTCQGHKLPALRTALVVNPDGPAQLLVGDGRTGYRLQFLLQSCIFVYGIFNTALQPAVLGMRQKEKGKIRVRNAEILRQWSQSIAQGGYDHSGKSVQCPVEGELQAHLGNGAVKGCKVLLCRFYGAGCAPDAERDHVGGVNNFFRHIIRKAAYHLFPCGNIIVKLGSRGFRNDRKLLQQDFNLIHF